MLQNHQFSGKRLQFTPRNPLAPALKAVIDAHRQFRGPHTLSGNIGDGFLYATNPIYRGIRDEFLRRGFSFTAKDIHQYFDFPMMCLDELLATGKIPYRKNFIWLETLEKSSPGTFTLLDLQRMSPNFNYLFHESAHFVAHSVFLGRTPMKRIPKSSESLLRIFLGEAFANTVECLSSTFSVGGIGGYFLDANRHFRADAEGNKIMREASQQLGFGVTIKILLASFLYSNFLYRRLGARELELISAISGAKKKKTIQDLAQIGFQLNNRFRTTATPLHLLKIGFNENLAKLMEFDPLERLLQSRNHRLLEKVDELVRTV